MYNYVTVLQDKNNNSMFLDIPAEVKVHFIIRRIIKKAMYIWSLDNSQYMEQLLLAWLAQ